MSFTQHQVDEFVTAYIAAALWSSSTDCGRPLSLDYNQSDISPGCVAEMRADCEAFIEANTADLMAYCERVDSLQWSDITQAGHDFWLTRNGHGAGFWDRGLDDLGDRLTKACKDFHEVDLYVGDDGLIYA